MFLWISILTITVSSLEYFGLQTVATGANSAAAVGSSRFLKSSQISIGHESATDIVAEAMNISALILDGERDSSTEGPFQNSIVFSLHHANKKANVSSISTINAF